MTAKTLENCLNMLGAMNSKQEWTEHVAALYTLAIREWADDVAIGAVEYAAMNEEWRPAPVRLREIATNLHAGVPNPAILREEIRSLLIRHGGERAHLAPYSHPILPVLADEMGGWRIMGRMTTERIDEAFAGAFSRAVKEYSGLIGDTLLRLPAAQRKALIAAPKRTEAERRELAAPVRLTLRSHPDDTELEPLEKVGDLLVPNPIGGLIPANARAKK